MQPLLKTGLALALLTAASVPVLGAESDPFADPPLPPQAVPYPFWTPESSMVAVADLGIPPLADDAPLTPPPIGLETRSAFYDNGNERYLKPDEQAQIDEANALLKAGKGAEAVALLESKVGKLPHAAAEIRLANVYLSGDGGIAKDVPTGVQWLARGAVVAPPFWHYIGRYRNGELFGGSTDAEAAARAWNTGVRGGCGPCATAMLDFWFGRRKGLTVSDADAFLWAVWAVELGSLNGLSDLEQVVTTLSADGPRRLDAAAALADKAKALAGTLDHRFGGLAAATFTTYRSGLVNSDWRDLYAEMETGLSTALLTRALGIDRKHDRQLGPYLVQLVTAADADPSLIDPKLPIHSGIRRVAISYGMTAGVLSLAPRVVPMAIDGRGELTLDARGNFKKDSRRFTDQELDTLLTVARLQGTEPDALDAAVRYARDLVAAKQTLRTAQNCARPKLIILKDDLLKEGRKNGYVFRKATPEEQGKAIRPCRSQVVTALNRFPDDQELQEWRRMLAVDDAELQAGIERAKAWEAENKRLRAAGARAAAPSATGGKPVGSLGSGSSQGPRPRPCRWKTYEGYGGGRVCVPE